MAANSDGSGKRRRGKGRPFTKGDQRINRAGRPKVYKEFVENYRELEPEAREVLRKQLKSRSEWVKQGAAKTILERAWGKAPQPLTAEGGEGAPKFDVVDAELLVTLQRMAEKLTEPASPPSKSEPPTAPDEKPPSEA